MSDTNTAASRGASELPLRGVSVALVGPGRVGTSLGRWLTALGARLLRVAGRRRRGDHAGTGSVWCPLESMHSDDADVLLIAVSDPALESVARTLAAAPQAKIVLHVSGHFDHSALAPLRSDDRRLGSWHPLRAFPGVSDHLSEAKGVTWAIDGHPEALAFARRLTGALKGRAVEVTGEERRLYHLAASLAAGGVMTVLAAADRLRRRAGLPDELMSSYLALTTGALAQAQLAPPIPETEFPAAITGPAARGDVAMLGRQRRALEALAPELTPLFDALNETTNDLRNVGGSRSQPPSAASLTAPDHR
ncbi:MAG: DUF2520 domain-containing protein [Acidobacteriota bacterium]